MLRARYQTFDPGSSGVQGLAANGGQVHIVVQGQHVISTCRGELREAQVEAYEAAVALAHRDPGALEAAADLLIQAGFEVTIV